MLDFLDHIQSGWQLAALAMVLLSVIFAGPRLRAFLKPPDDDPAPPAGAHPVLTGTGVGPDQLITILTSMSSLESQVSALTGRIAVLEASCKTLASDRDLLADATAVWVAWIDAGATPPPPAIAAEIRALLARVHTERQTP